MTALPIVETQSGDVSALPGLDHVSRTISVHMAQDDSTYRVYLLPIPLVITK
ncbi:conserved hypothetical protein [Ricinus communis]|uniref:Uncharacterized protein n=1 Tax=Ricinus communis TaxID=3988 RepID=B9RSP5_RICCO|nr:conserved hypothetical protein [Ricinus communis]